MRASATADKPALARGGMQRQALPKRSQLGRLRDPDAFWWATGIEDTFITEPWHLTGRTLDEYELTGHYDRWAEDLGLIAELGVSAARYGVPWHRIQPAPDRWDWDFADRTIDRLLDLGVEPIVDLVHYGLPRWIDGAFANPAYPELVADYAGRVSDSGEGRWTIKAAIDEAVPAPVLTTALYARFSSRGEADYQDKLLSAMRFQFGGHVEKAAGQ